MIRRVFEGGRAIKVERGGEPSAKEKSDGEQKGGSVVWTKRSTHNVTTAQTEWDVPLWLP